MGNNLIIAQSGGPTSVINASLAGAVRKAMESEKIGKVYGALYGIEGIIKEHIVDFSDLITSDDDIEKLKRTPAMALGSCRFKLGSDPDALEKILEVFRKKDIGYFLYAGGNDSMDTVDKLGKLMEERGLDIRCIGIPKTIDNDLVITDHAPGFPSAARYIATTFAELYADTDVYDKTTVTVVEVMGRNAGWLTGASALARRGSCPAPQLIYLPEIPFSYEKFEEDIRECAKTDKNIIVAVSEGIRSRDGEYISASKVAAHDTFGHASLSGTGKRLSEFVREKFGYKTRGIELSLLQRCASHLVSEKDVEEAYLCGEKAVEFAISGMNRVMATIVRVSSEPYMSEIKASDVSKIANHEKKVHRDWINEAGNDVLEEFIDYVRPLVAEEGKEAVTEFFVIDKKYNNK